MTRRLLLGLFALTLLGCNRGDMTTTSPSPPASTASTATAEQEAATSADAWLALVDAEKYGESWDQAASFFRGAVPREQWKQQVGGVRKPLGNVVSRKLKSKRYATTLPGAPDGKYVVIQYDTVFENKATAIETVTPMEDTDGKWRVSGYYIR
jgi:hypothetical protein